MVAMNEIAKQKVALVTGGGKGIGAAVALRLAAEGTDVALTYRSSQEQAHTVAKKVEAMGRRALVLHADSVDLAAVESAVDTTAGTLGGLDILVNNAAVFTMASVAELELADFERTMAVNVRAPFAAAKAAVRHLPRGGRIINIGSNVSQRAPFPGLWAYSTSKSALIGMTRALARELGPRAITVNLVNPGPTDTDSNPADGPNADAIAALTALGRFAEPEEIAAAVSYLAGEGGSYVTGAAIDVDGGFNG
ncbi:short-chain alcohol dehydrogenase like protein [Saccharomonospora marina XMU15]|uniref:Short-chain alcohol dehydrogenase like protein n=1 Tax=Saccharomonospora marina XMU15 TaxID=882083 RepID=H5X258_9PSEU|nr:short-chain alcohol dehydrogenase like protein [Saccharomonospora marina XMU15]